MENDVLSKKEHWDEAWQNVLLPRVIDINDQVLKEYHNVFTSLLTTLSQKKKSPLDLLEVGCGASAWLPYFKKYHNCNLYGVDYSQQGVDIARKNLSLQGATGEVVLGDMLESDLIFNRQFDVIVSFGFVEHFKQTDLIIKRMIKYLKPGGLIMTQIPNLRGLFGITLKLFNRKVYDIHNPMNLEQLKDNHEKAGLIPYQIPGYMGGVDIKMITSTIVPTTSPYIIKAGTATIAHYTNVVAYKVTNLFKNKFFQTFFPPDIFVVYEKK